MDRRQRRKRRWRDQIEGGNDCVRIWDGVERRVESDVAE